MEYRVVIPSVSGLLQCLYCTLMCAHILTHEPFVAVFGGDPREAVGIVL